MSTMPSGLHTSALRPGWLTSYWNAINGIEPSLPEEEPEFPLDHLLSRARSRSERREMSIEELDQVIEALFGKADRLSERMVDKAEVARRAGMTVSWLDNSKSELAKKLRALGVRYGSSHNSPVRFPLREVVELCQRPQGAHGPSLDKQA